MTDPTRIMECHKGSERCSGPMDISHKAVFVCTKFTSGAVKKIEERKLVVFRGFFC